MKYKIVYVLIFIMINFPIYANLSFYSKTKDYHINDSIEDSISINNSVFSSFSTDMLISSSLKDKLSKKIIEGKIGSIYIYNPEMFLTINSDVPHSYNDGSFWQGKGTNSKMSFGVEFSNEVVSLRLLPEFWVAQNNDFETITTESSSGYGDYWTEFDNLQRFGDKTYTELSFGQSDLRFTYNDILTLGLSTENIKLGPGKINNIILGSQGAGFPHVDFGTVGLIPFFSLGSFEFRTLYGVLTESDYFDEDSSNDHAWYSGTSLGLNPKIFPNLTLGLNHYYTKPLDDLDRLDAIRHIPGIDKSNSGVDAKDVMISFTFNYFLPVVDFHLYGELARNDSFTSINDLWRQPEHTTGYTIGLSKQIYTFDNSSKLVFSAEHTDLGQTRTYEVRPAGSWYRHAWAGWTQGYTNNGQLLGSSIGPGSNSQWAELSYVCDTFMVNFSFQRIAHDKDYYYLLMSTSGDDNIRQYTEAIIGLEYLYFWDYIDFFTRIEYNPHMYYNFEDRPTIHNIHLVVAINYKF